MSSQIQDPARYQFQHNSSISEVWFSLEGAPQWVKNAAQIFPLTHMLKAVRKIMHDGAGLMDVSVELIILTTMTLAFLIIGASLFSWNR